MELLELVKKALIDNKYDGLACNDCGCEIDNLCPCGGEGVLDCKPAHKKLCEDCNDRCVYDKAQFCMIAED